MEKSYENEIEKLYIELREKVAEEMKYLVANKDIDEKHLEAIVMEKRIISDKITKKINPKQLSNVTKIKIQAIIRVIIEMEEENKKIYNDKLETIKKELSNLEKERKLKKGYLGTLNNTALFDEKK